MTNSRSLLWLCGLLVAARSSLAFLPNHRHVQPSPQTATRSEMTKTALKVAMPLDDGIVRQQIEQQPQKQETLDPKDAWIANLDYDAFAKDVSALGKELRSQTGTDDVEHLNKIVGWRNIAALVGLATVWTVPNPITIVALSTWTYSSWAMIAHHTCHGGYNRVDAGKFQSRRFALGLVNRFVDWLDWMQPEAWNVEHNRLHHYNLNEGKDPDLVQRNLGFLRDSNVPMIAKYAAVLFFLPIWKWFYYAPNTYKEFRINEILKSTGKTEAEALPKDFDREEAATVVTLLDPVSAKSKALREVIPPHKFFLGVVGPMFLGRYCLVPAAMWALAGPVLAKHALVNLLLAELLTNVHAFITIVTNHGTYKILLYILEHANIQNGVPSDK